MTILTNKGRSSPIRGRRSKSGRCSGCSSKIRQLPSPIPILYFAHAFARFRLIEPAFSVPPVMLDTQNGDRSEERRVGKECREWGWPYECREKVRESRIRGDISE